MISFEIARQALLEIAPILDKEFVSLDQALGRILAEDLYARFDLPRFDNSAVDGYALCLDGEQDRFDLCGQIQAGQGAELQLRPGQAARIFTGAPIPAGTIAVVMQENVQVYDNFIVIQKSVQKGQNIRRAGEEFQQDQKVIEAKTPINPPILGLIATMGIAEIPVFRKVKASLLITGDELRSAGQVLSDGQIYDANGPALGAALGQFGVEVQTIGPVADTREAVNNALAQCANSDLILSAGGVSVGDFDWIRTCVLESNFEEVFWKVAIKPGKPFFVAKSDKQIFLGLPGNPVAALVMMQIFVRPLLRQMHGLQPWNALETLPTSTPIRHSTGRLEWCRAQINGWGATQTLCVLRGQDSHMLGAMSRAQVLIALDPERSEFQAGECIPFHPISWSL